MTVRTVWLLILIVGVRVSTGCDGWQSASNPETVPHVGSQPAKRKRGIVRDPEGIRPPEEAVLVALELTDDPRMWIGTIDHSPDGSMLATGIGDAMVTLWDAKTWEKITSSLVGVIVVFSPTGDRLASPHGTQVALVPVPELGPETILQDDTYTVYRVAFSPDGKMLAVHKCDRVIIWDLRTNQVERVLEADSRHATALAYSPDGKTLAATVSERGVAFWRAADWRVRLKIEPEVPANSVAFSPDGKLVATGGLYVRTREARDADSQNSNLPIQFWDARSGKLIAPAGSQTSAARVWMRHFGRSVWIAFSPDGKLLASSGAHETLKLWDVPSQRLLLTLHFPGGARFSFAPDGKTLAVGTGTAVQVLDIATLLRSDPGR